MRIGLTIGKYQWPGGPQKTAETLAEIAQTADEAGFYSLWVMDHLFQLGDRYGVVHGPVEDPMLEGYTTMAYCAALTQRIKLGLLVTNNLFRAPGLLVKTVTTLDVLSNGRAYLGIGTGWFDRETVGLGMGFPASLSERFERLEESLQIAHQMWAGDTTPFNGKHYQLTEPLNRPQSFTKPHPPIMIGGGGERKTLRLVAQYADACNLVIGSPYEGFPEVLHQSLDEMFLRVTHKLAILRQHCTDLNRPFDAIEKTVVTYLMLKPGAQTTGDVIEICQRLVDVGIQHVIFMMNSEEIEPVELIGTRVIPVVSQF